MAGTYQTLLGCVLQITKEATVINILLKMYTTSSFKSLSVSLKYRRRKNDTLTVIMDKAQAGVPAKRDFSVFITIIVKFIIYMLINLVLCVVSIVYISQYAI